jgi:four helix bundle protein
LNSAEGSLAETESLLRVSAILFPEHRHMLDSPVQECDEISRMLYSLKAKVQRRKSTDPAVAGQP